MTHTGCLGEHGPEQAASPDAEPNEDKRRQQASPGGDLERVLPIHPAGLQHELGRERQCLLPISDDVVDSRNDLLEKDDDHAHGGEHHERGIDERGADLAAQSALVPEPLGQARQGRGELSGSFSHLDECERRRRQPWRVLRQGLMEGASSTERRLDRFHGPTELRPGSSSVEIATASAMVRPTSRQRAHSAVRVWMSLSAGEGSRKRRDGFLGETSFGV